MAATAIAILAKGTLLLLATFGVATALRGASAAARHLVWAAGLAALIGLPVAEVSIPWHLEILPWGTPEAAAPAAPGPAIDSGSVLADRPDPKGDAPASAGIVDASPAPAEPAAASPVAAGPAASEGSALPFGWSWEGALLALWALGAAFVLARLAISMLSVAWLARRARPLTSADWYGTLGRVTERLSLRTPVRLLTTDRTPMPITCGIVRPSVLLPEDAAAWDEERREVVLLHELAHVRRADLVPHLMGWVACAAWWFHPMAWVAAKRLRAESEFACDDLVLGAGTRASAYAEHLLAIVRTAGRASSPAPAMPMAQRKGFEGRLLTILEPDVDRGRPSGTRRAILAAVFAVVAVSLAAMAPARPDLETADREAARKDEARSTARPEGRSDSWVALDPVGTEAGGETSAEAETDAAEEAAANAEAVGADGMTIADDAYGGDALRSIVRQVWRGSTDAGEKAREVLKEVAREDGETDGRNVTRLVAELALALKDVDVGVRVAAAQTLGGIDDPRSVAALSKALREDDSPEVRRAAAWALGEIENPAAIPALADALKGDADAEVRKMSAWALGEIEEEGGVDALGRALSDSSAEVRAMAIWGLGEIESPRAVPWLAKPLADGTVEERRKAAWALGQIESPASVEPLGKALADPDVEVRASAVWALGEIEAPQAVPWLARAIHDDSREVRKKAAWALGQIESPEGVEALAAALSDADVEVRKTVAWAIGEIQPDRAPQRLIDATRDSSSEVRENVAWALGEIEDPAAIPALRAMLNDANTEVRKDALHALMEFDDALAEDVLLDLLKSDDAKVREEAARALGKRN